jgi:alpha-beta hydrolase superfamily lysophospholipase
MRLNPLARSVCSLLFASTFFLSQVHAQNIQGFDPKAKSVPDFSLTPFYEANLDYVGRKPGEVIKSEVIPAPAGASAWRVMYVSRTWDERLVPVTGIVVAPNNGGAKAHPILNWLHGTTGGSRTSAPSLAPNPAQNQVQRSSITPIDYGVPYLTDFLERGFVVVATDYYGQGGPGVHQYMVGNTAARNGLDLVRAARTMKGVAAGSDVTTFGWSQGGHAAIFTSEEQPTYAPELRLRGVVAIAPGTTLIAQPINIPHMYVLARGYRDAYAVPLSEFTADGERMIDAAGSVSISGLFRKTLTMKGPFSTGEWSQEMKSALALNVPGNRKSVAPILIVHGTLDNVVMPETTKELTMRSAKFGNSIKVSWYAGQDHRTVVDQARKEILDWISEKQRAN